MREIIKSGYSNIEPFIVTLNSFHFVINPKKDQIFDSQKEALNTFTLIGEPIVEPLLSALQSRKNQILNHNAMVILGEIGEKRAVGSLIESLDDDFIPNISFALYALERIEDKNENPLLLPSILTLLEKFSNFKYNDEYKVNINKQLSKILIQIGRPSVPYLLQYLDEGKGNQMTILSALKEIKDESIIEPMINLILSKKFSDYILPDASDVLISYGDISVQPLEVAMRQEKPSNELRYLKRTLDKIKNKGNVT